MCSTNIPVKKDRNNFIVKCTTPDNCVYDYVLEPAQYQELQNILVSCNYKPAGCIANDHMKDIKNHEDKCLYRSIRCPFQHDEGLCEGVLPVNLVQHVTEHHSPDCISTDENIFSLPLDLSKEILVLKMVKIQDIILLFGVKCQSQKLCISLKFIWNTNPKLNCNITLFADNIKWNKHKEEFYGISNMEFHENEEELIVFDIDKLIQVQHVFNSIALHVECNIPTEQNDLIDSCLVQCAYCEDYVTGSYYQCETKHMHCEKCYNLGESWHNVKSNGYYDCYQDCCKLCNSVMKKSRELVTIKQPERSRFPCKNNSLGCKYITPRFILKHELLCPFRVVTCAFDTCEFKDKMPEFILHLKEKHPSGIVTTNTYHVNILYYYMFRGRRQPDKHTYACKYMFAFGSVFFCKFIDERTCLIEWISTSGLRENYVFKVSFHYKHGNSLSLSTHTDPREVNYKVNNYKVIYNTIKKIAEFKVYDKEVEVSSITFKVSKK